VLDLLLPQRCVACGAPGAQACGDCLASARRLRAPLCDRCGAPTAWPVARCRECAGRRLAFAHARAAVAYDGAVRQVVAAWKERGLRRLAEPVADVVAEAVAPPPVAALAAIPPDRERTLRRGHHPADGLAAALGARWELPVEPLLRRERGAPRQRGLSLPERRRNVSGAFTAVRRPPRAIALVDDVYTTGATAHAAASALRRAGAARVEVVTFARTIRLA